MSKNNTHEFQSKKFKLLSTPVNNKHKNHQYSLATSQKVCKMSHSDHYWSAIKKGRPNALSCNSRRRAAERGTAEGNGGEPRNNGRGAGGPGAGGPDASRGTFPPHADWARKAASIEKRIGEAEKEKGELERRITAAFGERKTAEGRALTEKLSALNGRIAELYRKWEKILEEEPKS